MEHDTADGMAPVDPQPPEAAEELPPFRGVGRFGLWWRSPLQALLLLMLVTVVGLLCRSAPLVLLAAGLLLLLGLRQLLPPLWRVLREKRDDPSFIRVVAAFALVLALLAIPLALGWLDPLLEIYRLRDWGAIGAFGEGVIGAVGQILVALVALAIAWRQVMVDQRLTGQQNRITQAQTIDSLIHGLSELIIDEEGLLEDWPLERMLAEGRLAAVLGSIDPEGKARVLRFLSHARLLTPLRRDNRLGRAILDGEGNYQEDRDLGVPVIQLRSFLRGANLRGTDLRGIDFNRADLRGADLRGADLSEANLAGTDLAGANLSGAQLEGCRLFEGRAQTATPSGAKTPRDSLSGQGTGARVFNADFRGVKGLDAANHAYLAAWSGPRSRHSLPGGPRGIPSRMETWPGVG
ncbi:MAG: pentapeptide repeat-containing protein [Synechococcaceae cyanobacterium]|nr:pentapeptide repeat-containing protein [Synechococcaceae cyanobacterium]